MKQYLFWALFIPNCFLMIVFALIPFGIGEWLDDRLHLFEGWCFDYFDEWEYVGSGIWRGKT